MNKRLIVPVALIALAGLMAGFASSAQAFPTQTSPCTGCHSGAGATISTTLVSTVGTNATYNFSAPGATAVAVFSGSTKLFVFTASTGQFTVPTGKTYSLFAVTGPTTSDGVGTASVSPAAAPVDATAPVTTSNALATYVSSAAITLSATDAGSGVAATYYKLDGGAQVAGTSINVTTVGSHTLEFWSVDVAGNIEAHKTASFTVTAPVPVPTGVYTVRTRISGEHVAGRVATLTNTTTGATFTARVGRNRIVTFANVPAGKYTLTVRGSRTRVITVPLAQSDSGSED